MLIMQNRTDCVMKYEKSLTNKFAFALGAGKELFYYGDWIKKRK